MCFHVHNVDRLSPVSNYKDKWKNMALSTPQIKYAALDVTCSLDIVKAVSDQLIQGNSACCNLEPGPFSCGYFSKHF